MTTQEAIGILLSILFGAIIGIERQSIGKPAGFRTNTLICLGAAIYTVIGTKMQGPDSTARIISQIITGVGFIGAGSIIRDHVGVHGLTTAATIWVVSGIGVACGAGFYLMALVLTILAVTVLLGFRLFEKLLPNKDSKNHSQTQSPSDPNITKESILPWLSKHQHENKNQEQ